MPSVEFQVPQTMISFNVLIFTYFFLSFFFFFYFPKKTEFNISCKLSLLKAICMKCQILLNYDIQYANINLG